MNEPWMDDAACADTDPNTWFPERGTTNKPMLAVCATCPVKTHCLEYAIAHGEHHGIWGGTSERQRRRIRQQRNKGAA
jgi:WhiB family redox-sensing transcriptional regulator